MLMRTKLLSRALLPCLCSLLASQTDFQQREVELNKEIVRVRAELSQARAGGLRAIRVNGTELTPERFQREVVHLVGAQSVKAKIGEFFVQEWRDRQIEEGARKAGDFVISDEKIVAELRGQVDEFKKKNPGVEFWEAVRALTGMDKDVYMQQRRNTEMFNLVFFPGPANKWPMITREAIMASAAGGDGKEFWDNVLNLDFMVDFGTISAKDLDLFHRSDSVDDAFDYITRSLIDLEESGSVGSR